MSLNRGGTLVGIFYGSRAMYWMHFCTVCTVVAWWCMQGITPTTKAKTNTIHSSCHCYLCGLVLWHQRQQIQLKGPNTAASEHIESDGWQQRFWERKSNSSSAAQYHKRNPLMMAGKQITQFGFDYEFRAQIMSQTKLCWSTSLSICCHTASWCTSRSAQHTNTGVNTATRRLKPQIVFYLPNNLLFTPVCVYLSQGFV